MLNLSRVLQDDRLRRASIGMPLSQFAGLLPSFRAVYERSQLEYRPMSERQRGLGGGRKAQQADKSVAEHRRQAVLPQMLPDI